MVGKDCTLPAQCQQLMLLKDGSAEHIHHSTYYIHVVSDSLFTLFSEHLPLAGFMLTHSQLTTILMTFNGDLIFRILEPF